MLNQRTFYAGTIYRAAGFMAAMRVEQGRIHIVAGAPAATLFLPPRTPWVPGGPYFWIKNLTGATLTLNNELGASIGTILAGQMRVVVLLPTRWYLVPLPAGFGEGGPGRPNPFGYTPPVTTPGPGTPPTDTGVPVIPVIGDGCPDYVWAFFGGTQDPLCAGATLCERAPHGTGGSASSYTGFHPANNDLITVAQGGGGTWQASAHNGASAYGLYDSGSTQLCVFTGGYGGLIPGSAPAGDKYGDFSNCVVIGA